MKTLKSLAIVFGVSLFLLSLSTRADESNKETKITFSGPVQVANTQLPAGTYVFKLADTLDRHIVQIYNEDQSQIIATIVAIPDERVQPADNTVIKFAETSDGSAASGTLPDSGIPIKEWFYPGETSGQEFHVVSQSPVAAVQPEAVVESGAITEPQPESPAAPASPEPSPESSEAAASPEPQTEAPAAAAPAEESAAPVAQAETPQAAQPEAAPEQPAAPEQLPQTASQMPLVGLIGILALVFAASLRIFLKVSA